MQAMICMSTREDGRLDYFNKRFYEYTGFTPATLPDPPIRPMMHPDDYDEAFEKWTNARAKNEPFIIESRLRRHDGVYRWHMARAAPLAPNEHGVQNWMLTIVDIHDRKMAEDAVRISEERYRTLADSMEAIVCMSTREDGTIDFFNKRFYEYTGLSPDNMPDPPVLYHVLHPDDFPRAVRAWVDAHETGEPFQGEYRFRRYDGRYRWHIGRANPIPTVEGEPQRWVFAVVDIDDQKRAEEALRFSETRYRTLVDAAPVFVYNADANSTVTFASESFHAFTGVRPEGQSILAAVGSVLHPDDLHAARRAWAASHDGTEPFDIEARVRAADGTYVWFLSRIVPVLDESSGIVTGWIGTSTNIDEQKRAEEALLASREEYRTLTDTIPALVTTNTADGKLIFANRHYYEYTGLSTEEAPDWPRLGIMPPEDQRRLFQEAQASLQGDGVVQDEVRMRRADGALRWHLIAVRAVRDQAGNLQAWIGVTVDINEHRIARSREELLASARSLLATSMDYEQTLDNLVKLLVPRVAEWAAIHVRTDDGKIKRVALTYTDPAMKPYADAGDVVDPEGSAGIARVLRTGEPELISIAEAEHYTAVREDARDLLRDTGIKSCLLLPLMYHGKVQGALAVNSVTPYRYHDDDLAFGVDFARTAAVVLEHARLYSALQQTAADLRAANAAKDEFLGLVSHELKTPITTILGNAEVLHKRAALLDDDARASALGDIQHEAVRLHQIIENLLILARLDRGREIEMEPVLVPHIIDRIVEDHRARHPDRPVDVTIDASVAPVQASDVYLEQVLRNLLSNAEKYSPLVAPIEVRLACDHDLCTLDVMDRGAGVPPDERRFIFDPFYRAQTAGHVAGVGIGLAVCKRLVEAQGGAITYEPREGGGSRFRVTLPCYREELATV
jgi:PAS domain S-box-containing protein